MEHSDHYVHHNHMVFGIVCCCFVCFMFAGCAFMEKGECRHFISLDLEGKRARLFVLVLLLMKTGENLAPIGALDYERMRSREHMKERYFGNRGTDFGRNYWGNTQGAKYSKSLVLLW